MTNVLNRRGVSRRVAAIGFALLIVSSAPAKAGVLWKDVQGPMTPTQGQLGPGPAAPLTARMKPRYIAGYAGTSYPPLGSRYQVMRPNYQRKSLRGLFGRLKGQR